MDDIAAISHKGVHGPIDLAKVRRHSVQHQRPLLNMTGCLTVHCPHCHVLSNPERYQAVPSVLALPVLGGRMHVHAGAHAKTGGLHLANTLAL